MRAHPTPRPSGAVRRLAGAALTVAVTGLTTTTAFAADAGNLEVSPSPARPGSTVTLRTVACGPGGSAGIDASSLGGGILGLEPQDAESGTAEGSLHIPADTRPGNYAVGGSCTDGQELTGTVVVGDERRMAEEKDVTGKEKPGKEQSGKDQPAAEPHDRAVERDMHQGKGEAPDRHARDSHARDSHARDGHAREHQPWDRQAPDDHAQAPHHDGNAHERGRSHHPAADPRADRHAPMPHGRVHTGVGGGTDGMSSAQLAGGATALTAAAGSVLYLRRRSRTPGR